MNDGRCATCGLCGGTGLLTQRGIASAFLMPWKSSLVLIATGCAAGMCYSPYAFTLVAVGYVLPLASADLRLLLYPFVALAALMGRKVNCPNCSLDGSLFR